MIILFAILMGAAIGSFLNLCADRLPAGKSVVRPASCCDECHRPLKWTELVPVLSFLLLRGKCGTCHQRIPLRVLLVEVAAAAVVAFSIGRYGPTVQGLALALYLLVFLLLCVTDLEKGLLPDAIVLPAAGVAALLSGFALGLGPLVTLAGGVAGFAIMLVLYLLARGGMGAGDVKLAGLVGLTTGFPLILPALVVAAISGGTVGTALLVTRKKGRRDAVPFGPFLAIGAVLCLVISPGFWTKWLGLS